MGIYERLAHSPCMNELYIALSAAVATSDLAERLAYTVTGDFKEVAKPAGIL